MSKLSIIVPAHNEEGGIADTINGLNKLTGAHNCQVIVVDDGSFDRTYEISSALNCEVIRHENNIGYGAAIKTGIKIAKYEIIVIIDADGTYPIDKIPELVDVFVKENADMVVAARTGINVNIPLIRKPPKWIINKLANYLAETKIPDLNSGLRVMRKDVVEKYIYLLPNGFSFTTTITLAMLTNLYRVRYVAIDYFKRSGKSKVRPIYDTLNYFQLIVRTIMYFNPLKVFLPLSLAFFLIGIILLLFRLFVAKMMLITTIVFFISGFQTLFFGLLADLVVKQKVGK
jgi:glycosyltransferase involved in cell wall biosynthesis